MQRFPVRLPQPIATAYGRRRKPAPGALAGWIWQVGRGEWRFETANMPGHSVGSFGSRADASAACMVEFRERELIAAREQDAHEYTARIAAVSDVAKAALDPLLCMERVCEFRGPMGEHYDVRFVGAPHPDGKRAVG